MPPETSMRCPLIQRLSSDSSEAIIGPMSSGSPARPSAVISATRRFTSGLSRCSGPRFLDQWLGGLRWLDYGNPIVSKAVLTTAIPSMPMVIMLAVQYRAAEADIVSAIFLSVIGSVITMEWTV